MVQVVRHPIRQQQIAAHWTDRGMHLGVGPRNILQATQPRHRPITLVQELLQHRAVVLFHVFAFGHPSRWIDLDERLVGIVQHTLQPGTEVLALFVIQVLDDLQRAPLLRRGSPAGLVECETCENCTEHIAVPRELMDEVGAVLGAKIGGVVPGIAFIEQAGQMSEHR